MDDTDPNQNAAPTGGADPHPVKDEGTDKEAADLERVGHLPHGIPPGSRGEESTGRPINDRQATETAGLPDEG